MELALLQEEVKVWTDYNFGPSPNVHKPYQSLLGIVEEFGELYHAADPAEIADGIGDAMIYMADYCNGMGLSLQVIERTKRKSLSQMRTGSWLGVIGKLCHAHLKMEQGIRGHESVHLVEIQICLGYLIDSLKQFAMVGLKEKDGFEIAIEDTWYAVKQRDWTKNKEKG